MSSPVERHSRKVSLRPLGEAQRDFAVLNQGKTTPGTPDGERGRRGRPSDEGWDPNPRPCEPPGGWGALAQVLTVVQTVSFLLPRQIIEKRKTPHRLQHYLQSRGGARQSITRTRNDRPKRCTHKTRKRNTLTLTYESRDETKRRQRGAHPSPQSQPGRPPRIFSRHRWSHSSQGNEGHSYPGRRPFSYRRICSQTRTHTGPDVLQEKVLGPRRQILNLPHHPVPGREC